MTARNEPRYAPRRLEILLTDERPAKRAPGTEDDPPPGEHDTYDDAWTDERSAADEIADPDRDEPDAAVAAEPADDGRRRPSLPIIISAVLLLAAIGAGLAFLLPSGPIREVDQLVPTAAPTVPGQPAAELPTPPPMLQATGEYSSTEVIAEVGAGTITRGDFVRSYQPGADPSEVLNQLIQYELVVQAADAEGVAPDEAAITARIEEIKQSEAGGDTAQFQVMLDQAMVGSEANLRRLLTRSQVVEQMVLKHTTAEQARARHILLATDATTDTVQIEQTKTEAEDLLKQIEAGADFAALAAEHSDDPGSAQTGGDLGWALRGVFVPPFDEAVFSMAKGERRLVQTDFGWHIIELLDEPAVRPLENTDLLNTQPGQDAFNATFLPWIEQLQQAAEATQQIKIVVPADQLVSTPQGS